MARLAATSSWVVLSELPGKADAEAIARKLVAELERPS